MRLSEKTLELNICAQISARLSSTQIFFFGLTQKQEAKAGFDVCSKLGGRLLVFQFKASNNVLKTSGERKFLAPHYQLDALVKRTRSHRSVFYALPNIGNTMEMHKNPSLLPQTWLLDVASLPSIGPPTKADGTLRKNGCHNMYLKPGKLKIHSDPINANLTSLDSFVSEGFLGSEGFQRSIDNNVELFLEFCSYLRPGARGAVLYEKL